MRYLLIIFCFISLNNIKAQDSDTLINISTVHISAERIELPFNAKSHAVHIIDRSTIENTAAQNVAELLQNVAGIDVQRRGVLGAQSDISIRGGSFEQILLLIDGLKVEDAQTGHHTMNLPITLDEIERIEIIKGPAARIYGLNAFGGAINIITKKESKEDVHLTLGLGSFGTSKIGFGFHTGANEKVKQSFNFTKIDSKGYRYNTDIDNQFFTYSAHFGQKQKYQLLASFSERKFGANGFYASPQFKDQYEETRTSLVGIQSRYSMGKFIIKPKIYWRRNMDTYIFLRDNPSYYKNVHVTQKYAAEMNSNYSSKLGTTGLGLEYNHTEIKSNNLGNHKRNNILVNLEHRFYFDKINLDITPGVAYINVSDAQSFILPGIDLGFDINSSFRLYANWGQTARIPTYTDLYYVGPTTLGNAQLESELATTIESGIKLNYKNLKINLSVYQRNAHNLIDWAKDSELDKWEARNYNDLSSLGIETQIDYHFSNLKFVDKISLGYLYQDNKQNDTEALFSRYAFNNIKNHVTAGLKLNLGKTVFTSFNYKYIDRVNYKDYTLLDARIGIISKKIKLNIDLNNLLDTEYQETSMVPMPGRHIIAQVYFTL